MTDYLIVALLTIAACVAIGVIVREWEIAAQRRERHRLKNQVAVLMLRVGYYQRLLDEQGVPYQKENGT